MNHDQTIQDRQLQMLLIKGRTYKEQSEFWRGRFYVATVAAIIGWLFVIGLTLLMVKLFPKTESHSPQQFPAVVGGCDSPKGLGTAGYEPLMQNLRADYASATAIGLLPGTLFHAPKPLIPPGFPTHQAAGLTPARGLASGSVCGPEAFPLARWRECTDRILLLRPVFAGSRMDARRASF